MATKRLRAARRSRDGLTRDRALVGLDQVYAPRGAELCLVRPDGHIGARAPLAEAGAIEGHLAGVLAGLPFG